MIKKLLLPLIIVMIALPIAAMNPDQQAMNLDRLPRELVGKILCHMAQDVGTPEMVNEADLPVIVHYAKALSLVNKNLYERVNNTITSQMLINALSHRFGMEPVDVVGKLNTPGAREWLKEYLGQTGEYELFKQMHRVFDIMQEVSEEFKALGVYIEFAPEEPESNSHFYQTKQGMFLGIDRTPQFLSTPWGEVELPRIKTRTHLAQAAFTQNFLKRVKVLFYSAPTSTFDQDRVEYYEFILPTRQPESYSALESATKKIKHWMGWQSESPDADLQEALLAGLDYEHRELYHPISQEEIATRVGTPTLISNCFGIPANYKILEVDGSALTTPEVLNELSYRSSESSDLIWEILQDQYDQENLSHDLAQLSLKKTKKTISQEASVTEITPQDNPLQVITSPQTAVEKCIPFLALLDAQPLFTGKGLFVNKCKVLPLNSNNDARLINYLCHGVQEKMGRDTAWDIHSCGDGNQMLEDEHGRHIKNGISEWIYDGHAATRCSLDQMKEACHAVIADLQSGWQQAKLINYQDILQTESEEEWLLLIKSKNFPFEDNLMGMFINALHLQHESTCFDDWVKAPDGTKRDGMMYMWIKKKALQKVVLAFGLKIDNSTP